MSTPSTRRERKRQAAHDEIVATAAALFARDGFSAVTMEQIAAAADVAKATLYSHFPTRDAIAAAMVRADIAASEPEMLGLITAPGTTASRLEQLFDSSVRWIERNTGLFPAYLRHRFSQMATPDGDRRRSGFGIILTKVLEHGQDNGEIRSDISAEALSENLQMLFLGVTMRCLTDPDPAALRSDFNRILTLFLHGAAPR
ncbi:TetR/AcrR family transcriptional regulator [Novispirillum itersonii]|uniref:AcrR family transcriptional regulator n=1 Tax=Novispirillum itersonii TaxID=189 RepID=A0A7W9ZH67_NOVIT|nr:TetR/AcrR family transcriptional regulator [Novispirillum itersonii]MBB6211175.1 AcrR family transcriptional regulator [Novispirillum itersonii]